MANTFSAESHTYAIDGRVVPSVTQVIRDAIGGDPRGLADRWCMERGSAVHVATALLDRGILDESSVDTAIGSYLAAYRKFREQVGTRMACIEIERPRFDTICAFAGTPDRVIEWDGELSILEIKTGSRSSWHAIQTAAYRLLATETRARLALYLRADGAYALDTHRDATDLPTFQAMLRIWWWKRHHEAERGEE